MIKMKLLIKFIILISAIIMIIGAVVFSFFVGKMVGEDTGQSKILNSIDSTSAKLNILDTNSFDNSEVLTYCRFYINENFYNLLKFKDRYEFSKFKFSIDSLIANKDFEEPLFYGLFVGGIERYNVRNLERGSGDISLQSERFIPRFYEHYFYKHDSQFICTLPAVPQEIKSYEFKENILYTKTTEKVTSIKKLSNEFNNEYMSRVLLNHKYRMIDIPKYSNKLNVHISNINHVYFQDLLELILQDKCGAIDGKYLDHWFEF